MVADKEMIKRVVDACICKGCPTYAECGERTGFCFLGKSKCITKEKGCICGGCPVHQGKVTGTKMEYGYYCIRDSEDRQKMAKGKKGM